MFWLRVAGLGAAAHRVFLLRQDSVLEGAVLRRHKAMPHHQCHRQYRLKAVELENSPAVRLIIGEGNH